jgi:hypothetical protein
MADNYELTVVSVGYRLAPEDPWPAGAHDCYDAAEWLVRNGKEKFGGELVFTGGEVCVLYHTHIFSSVPLQITHTPTSPQAAISPVS